MATLETAVVAAVRGPERKKLKIYNHEFNVKPAHTQHRNDGSLIVDGQISHHLTWRPDDQVYYLFVIRNGRLESLQRRIGRGGLTPILSPVASVVATYLGVPVSPEQVAVIGRSLGTVMDGKWETACDAIIARIALEYQQNEASAFAQPHA